MGVKGEAVFRWQQRPIAHPNRLSLDRLANEVGDGLLFYKNIMLAAEPKPKGEIPMEQFTNNGGTFYITEVSALPEFPRTRILAKWDDLRAQIDDKMKKPTDFFMVTCPDKKQAQLAGSAAGTYGQKKKYKALRDSGYKMVGRLNQFGNNDGSHNLYIFFQKAK